VTFTDVVQYLIMPKAQIQIQISFSPAPQKISKNFSKSEFTHLLR
jgi:hypothetical protein